MMIMMMMMKMMMMMMMSVPVRAYHNCRLDHLLLVVQWVSFAKEHWKTNNWNGSVENMQGPTVALNSIKAQQICLILFFKIHEISPWEFCKNVKNYIPYLRMLNLEGKKEILFAPLYPGQLRTLMSHPSTKFWGNPFSHFCLLGSCEYITSLAELMLIQAADSLTVTIMTVVWVFEMCGLFPCVDHPELDAQVPAQATHSQSWWEQCLWIQEHSVLYSCLSWDGLHLCDLVSKPQGTATGNYTDIKFLCIFFKSAFF